MNNKEDAWNNCPLGEDKHNFCYSYPDDYCVKCLDEEKERELSEDGWREDR